jgi:hypothetical protein
MTSEHTPSLGWRPIPAPPTGAQDPTRPSEVEARLAALLDTIQSTPHAGAARPAFTAPSSRGPAAGR